MRAVVPNLDQIVDRVRDAAGADFAFVLTKRGRLVTQNAPQDMPETGRARLVAGALRLGGRRQVAELPMPREHLVPFGGAAPVDVFITMAAGQAVLCVVMSSWADKRSVLEAIQVAIGHLEALLGKSSLNKASRTRPPSAREPAPPTREPARRRAPSTKPPGKRTGKTRRPGPMAGLVQLSGGRARPSPKLEAPPMIEAAPDDRKATRGAPRVRDTEPPPIGFSRPFESMPEIVISTAPVGRETLAAIEQDASDTGPAHSTPDIRVELTSIGRETELDLRREEEQRMHSLAHAPKPDALVASAALRMTQPWAEAPVDAKRAADAARRGRKLAAPKVTLKLDDPDDDVLEALLVDDVDDTSGDVPTGSRPPAGGAKARSSKTIKNASGSPSANAKGAKDGAANRGASSAAKGKEPRSGEDSWDVPPPPPESAAETKRSPKPSLDVWREAIERATREQAKPRR
jgi:hypothetical protein